LTHRHLDTANPRHRHLLRANGIDDGRPLWLGLGWWRPSRTYARRFGRWCRWWSRTSTTTSLGTGSGITSG